MELNLDKKEIRDIESVIVKQMEKIVFSLRRDAAKKNGKFVIENRSGDLRKSIKKNKSFIKVNGNKIDINIDVVKYYLFLDEGTKHIDPWYLTEAVFEDKEIRDVIKKVTAASTKRALLNIISKM